MFDLPIKLIISFSISGINLSHLPMTCLAWIWVTFKLKSMHFRVMRSPQKDCDINIMQAFPTLQISNLRTHIRMSSALENEKCDQSWQPNPYRTMQITQMNRVTL